MTTANKRSRINKEILTNYNQFLKLLIIVGTRPEIIRLAAVINECRQYFDCLLALNFLVCRRIGVWQVRLAS